MIALKRRLPALIFFSAFLCIVFLSFKHERVPQREEATAATAQEQMDQLSLTATHTDPAPTPSTTVTNLQAGIAAITPPNAHDLTQLSTLNEILAAKNDNDPRLDKELRQLSPEAKRLMRNRYATLPAENRNQRGTVVYLMGRELAAPDDVAFLRSVLNESPCLSLSNCAAEDRSAVGSKDHDHDGTNEVTLAYPQLVALKAIENYLARPEQGPLSPSLVAELESARHSRVAKVASLAESISREYHAKHP